MPKNFPAIASPTHAQNVKIALKNLWPWKFLNFIIYNAKTLLIKYKYKLHWHTKIFSLIIKNNIKYTFNLSGEKKKT